MQLSIIIVSYNVKYFLEQCLYAAMRACEHLDAEIIVVDNASSDGSLDYLRPRFPEVQFIENKTNPGFGAACNQGLAASNGSWFLFLNPDTIVPEDCFTKSIAFFESQPDCGGLGLRMLDGSGKFLPESKRMLPDVKTSFFKMLGTAKWFPKSKRFARYYAGHLPEKATNPVEVLAGAYMMLNHKAASATGGFDTDYFMYGEDVDLSFRIQKAGMKNYYFADASIIHFKGESTQRASKHYVKHFYGAMHLFVKKHYSQSLATIFLQGAIAGIKSMAYLKAQFQSLFNTSAQDPLPERFITIGTKPDLESLASFNLGGAQTIELQEPCEASTLLKILESEKFKEERPTIVFVTGGLDNQTILTVMDTRKDAFRYLFHHAGSGSIVGSDSGTGVGRVMTHSKG